MKNLTENFRGGGMGGSGRTTGIRRMGGMGRGNIVRPFRPMRPGITSYNKGFLYPQRHFYYRPHFYNGLYYYPYYDGGNYYYPYYFNNNLYYYPYNSSYCFCENRDILDLNFIIDEERCIRDKCGHYVPSSVCRYCQIV